MYAKPRLLISRWTSVRLKIESEVYHRRNELIFLLTVAALPAGDADWLTRFIRAVAQQKCL